MKRDFLRAFVLVMGFLLLIAEVDRQDEQVQHDAALQYEKGMP